VLHVGLTYNVPESFHRIRWAVTGVRLGRLNGLKALCGPIVHSHTVYVRLFLHPKGSSQVAESDRFICEGRVEYTRKPARPFIAS
jgi:hypothetical protein